MPEIKIRLADADLARLTAEAAAAGIPRAQLIRDRALAPAVGVARLRTMDYHSMVADAARFMRGDLNRQHVETLVAYVLTQLDKRQREAAARGNSAA